MRMLGSVVLLLPATILAKDSMSELQVDVANGRSVMADASPAWHSESHLPVATLTPGHEMQEEILELRQAPVNPAIPPPLAPGAVAPTVTTTPTGKNDAEDFVTVEWVETRIGGTYSTWVPITIFFHYPERTPGPQPGIGAIGMGSLIGQPGKTKVAAMGAAPSHGPVWARGVAVAVGAGLAGVLV